ncbi:hypothetical protein GKQ38_04240 [Candidatus Nanohaloarchaea archaeon]|nr:hypothetical protein GKQ38_04240 [Candidatus Nanohaloarchaea archaeon]
MRKYLALLLALTLTTGIASAQPSDTGAAQSNISAGLTPASPLYGIEMFAENLEVKLAGLIGGSDMKAKAMANNAEERLAEAQELIEKNRSSKATQLIERYSHTINESIEIASRGQNEGLKQRINNISSRNVEMLKKVKEKVPAQAQDAIQKAIEQSEERAKAARNRTGKPEGITGRNSSVQPPEAPGEGKAPKVSRKTKNRSIDEILGGESTSNKSRKPPQPSANESSVDKIVPNQNSSTSERSNTTRENAGDTSPTESLKNNTELNKSSDTNSLNELK